MSGLFERPALTRLILPPALHAALIAHAVASPTLEVCGLLGGRGETATSLYPLANVAEAPATTFFIDPRAQIGALQTMRARDEDLLGIFHSHPASPAQPSPRDLELAAYPGVAYLIVSLAGPQAPVVGGFVFDGTGFAPLPVVVG